MSFFKKQEEKLAARFLRWQYEKERLPLPAEAELMQQAARIVSEAHRIGRERGGNLLAIMKEVVADFMRKK